MEGWKRKNDMDVTFINLLTMIPTLYKCVASLEPFIALFLLLLSLLIPSNEVCAQKKYSAWWLLTKVS